MRNQFLFERPISFGFRLIAFFPLFALTYLRKKNIRNQILFLAIFGLLIFSTQSRAAIAVRIVEAFAIFLILYREHFKKWLRVLIILFI
ncbi:MAG: hypothetical protein LBI53_02365 [Candidatus Peribacteria bacterium]|nr:hypothetical protein [Candidatus Peribacteria bacterium]